MAELNATEVVLVEDNPNDVELVLRALKKNNITNNITVLHDGEEALEYLFANGEAKRPKCILLDLKLPKVTGLEVLKRLKSDERTRTIPVVALTSSNEDRDIQECYRLGVNSYVTKPVEFGEFVKAVKEMGLYWLLLNEPPR